MNLCGGSERDHIQALMRSASLSDRSVCVYSAGSRGMVLSKQEKEAVKMGLPVFTVRTAWGDCGTVTALHYEKKPRGARQGYIHKPFLYSRYYSDSDDEVTVEQRRRSAVREWFY